MDTPVADWVLQTTKTTGTGLIELGSARPGYADLKEALKASSEVWYSILSENGSRECGIGYFDATANTLKRSIIHATLANGVHKTIAPNVVLDPIFLQGISLVSCTFNSESWKQFITDLQVGQVTSLPAGSPPTVTNVGTHSVPILNFGIPDGATGPAGPAGPAGPIGPQPTVTAGVTTTGAPGSSALVVNSGTPYAAVFDFTIPQGPQGIQGPEGPVGPQGPQGPQGLLGPVGPVGPQGAGLAITGVVPTATDLASIAMPSINNMYLTADTGRGYVWDGSSWVDVGPVRGPQGAQGAQGAQGIQGVKGDKGDIGTAATITLLPTVVSEAGTNPDVINEGSDSAAVFRFTLPKGGEAAVNSISELKNFPDPHLAKTINTLGFYLPGDGGGGLWYWDPTSTALENKGTVIASIHESTGRWLRVETTPVNVRWFGAKGDGATDDSIAFQSAIDYAITSSIGTGRRAGDLRLSPGVYRITAPLILYYLSSGKYAYFSLTISADASGFLGIYTPDTPSSWSSANKTVVFADFDPVETPAFIIQTCRYVQFQDFEIVGAANRGDYPNDRQALYDLGTTGNGTVGQLTTSIPWWLQQYKNNAYYSSEARDNRFSPQACVVIDPFNSTAITLQNAYPSLLASGWYDASRFNTSIGTGSSIIKFYRVTFRQSIVGVAAGVASGMVNGEFITFYSCNWFACKSAVAFGSSQNKGCALYDSRVEAAQTFINLDDYGTGGAPFPLVEQGYTTSGHKWFMRARVGIQSGAVKDFYCEGLLSFGYWGMGGIGGRPLNIFNTTLKWSLPTDAYTGTVTSGSQTITNISSPASNFYVNGKVFGRGIPPNTVVTNVGTNTLTISNPATNTYSSTAIYGGAFQGIPPSRMNNSALVNFIGGSNFVYTNARARHNYVNSAIKFFGTYLDGEPYSTSRNLLSFDGCTLQSSGGATSYGLRDKYIESLNVLGSTEVGSPTSPMTVRGAPNFIIENTINNNYIRYRSISGWKDYIVGSHNIVIDAWSGTGYFITDKHWMLQVGDFISTSTPWYSIESCGSCMKINSISVKLVNGDGSLGSELLTNGEFDVGTNWTLGTGWSIVNGKAIKSAVGSSSIISQAIAGLVAGNTYRVTIDFDSITGGWSADLGDAIARIQLTGGVTASKDIFQTGVGVPSGIHTFDLVANSDNNTFSINALLTGSLVSGLSIGRVSEIDSITNTVYLTYVPVSFESGTYNITMSRLPEIRQRTIGTISSGSSDITGVTPIGGWATGKRIHGNGIPDGAYIKSVSGSTLTISANATLNGVIELYDAKLIVDYHVRSSSPGAGVIPNGDFTTDTAWNKTGSASIANGEVTLPSTSSSVEQDGVIAPSTLYNYSITVTSISTPMTLRLMAGGGGSYPRLIRQEALTGPAVLTGTYTTNAADTGVQLRPFTAGTVKVSEVSMTLATDVWIEGDFVTNSSPSKDASNMTLTGWICTESGAPGTWEPIYSSSVSPAT